ncbi:MAG: ABC transporter substrate-binding protein [Rhodobacteraceae bacterium]|nr:ABC transporter substrate-binding protein [Paracoccaceae bacterium]
MRRRPVSLALALAAATALGSAAGASEEGVIVAHGIKTFGELDLPADFAHLRYVNPDAPKGGEMSIWAFGGFDSMHPYSVKGRGGALSTIFFETLLEGTADEVGAAYCLVCTTLEYPEDRSWVVFNLRDDVTFSDGTPLTADDVLFSYEILLAKGLTDFRTVLSQQVEGATVEGPHRIRFDFRDGVPTRDLPETVGTLPIFSRASYTARGVDFDDSTLVPLTGSGPYVLDRMDVGKTLVYRRNPAHWGWDHPMYQGRANFDTIRVEYYADYDAAFEGFKAGSYHFRNEARAALWATGYDFPAVAAGHVRKVALPDGNIATGQSFIFNLRREQFRDVRVREAIGLMFNFEWSNETLFNGLYARINSFWENSPLAAAGPPGEAERAILEPLVAEGLLPATILTEPAVMAPTSGARQLDRGNLRAAGALLDAAGWAVGSDGLRRNAAGRTLRVEFLSDSPSFDRIINPYVDNLRTLGVDAVQTRVDSAQQEFRERNYDFDVVTHNFPMSYIPGAGLKQYFGSETADVSVFNLPGLRDAAVDRLIEVVLAARTPEELAPAVQALDRVLRSLRIWVPQWFKNVHTVAYYDMYEHPDPLPPFALGNLDFWWWNAAGEAALRAAGAIR